MDDNTRLDGRQGNVTADEVVTLVMRGLLHELANVATVVDGIRGALEHDGASATGRAREDLTLLTDRIFQLHGDLRALLPDREGRVALDPRAIAAEVIRLLAWHGERPCSITLDDGTVAPILGEAWQVRRQLLEACDAAAGAAATFRFSFRVVDERIEAVDAAGTAFWSAPTLAAARSSERGMS